MFTELPVSAVLIWLWHFHNQPNFYLYSFEISSWGQVWRIFNDIWIVMFTCIFFFNVKIYFISQVSHYHFWLALVKIWTFKTRHSPLPKKTPPPKKIKPPKRVKMHMNPLKKLNKALLKWYTSPHERPLI